MTETKTTTLTFEGEEKILRFPADFPLQAGPIFFDVTPSGKIIVADVPIDPLVWPATDEFDEIMERVVQDRRCRCSR